jgi:hypothetical protein
MGPLRTAPYAAQDPAVGGGIEHLAVSWRPALAPDVSSYVLRFRRVGAAAWMSRTAAATATAASLTTWPALMPPGAYEVQVGTTHPGAPVPTLWSPSVSARVSALQQRATASSTVLRPFVDGVQDSIRFAASANLPTTGVIRILSPKGRVVRTAVLRRGTSWAIAWTGRDARGHRVRRGTYRADVRLVGRGRTAARVRLFTFTVVAGRARTTP